MLIEKPILAGDVVCLRLTTGEEVVGRVVFGVSGERITITKPIQLQMHADPKNGQIVGVGFAPFMVGVAEDSNFTIDRHHLLVSPLKARADIADQYQQATSAIEMPKKSGLII